MAVADRVSLDDQAYLQAFVLSCVDLLSLDDLWTTAAESRDAIAPELGNRLISAIGDVRAKSSKVPDLMLQARIGLNAGWPELRKRLLSEEQASLVDTFLAKYGQLGDAAVALAGELDSSLAGEARVISAQLDALERDGRSTGDLGRFGRVLLGVLLVAAASVAAGLVAGVVAGELIALGALAGVGATILYDALKRPEAPPPTPTLA